MACDTGHLKDSERLAVLAEVNLVRSRHGLLPVTYDASQDTIAAQAALYMAANKALVMPTSSGFCYTPDAPAMALSSNLTMAVTTTDSTQSIPSTQSVVGSLINDSISSLSQRRRLLNPFLGKVTFGRAEGLPMGTGLYYMASVLKVVGNDVADVSPMLNDFVAYPYGNYPASDFNTNWYLSFSAIASKTNAAANGSANVNYAGATITVSSSGTALPVTNVNADYAASGLPNSLQWKVTGLLPNVTYDVQISNVVVNGVVRQYNYSFRLQ